jgi:hypothetical protein
LAVIVVGALGDALLGEGNYVTPDLVSTIIPVFNRPVQLREAVRSVLAQSYRPLEIIIVDDGSTDQETFALAKSLEALHPGVIRAVTKPNGGPGLAREAGRQLVRGEFIQYLDSDDVLLPEKFAMQVGALRRRPDAGVAYGKTRFRHADGTVEPGAWKDSGIERDAMFPTFLNDRWWDTPTPLYRRTVCDAAGAWTDARIEEDWEYDCRIAALGTRLAWVDSFVCEVRDHASDRLSRGTNEDSVRVRFRAQSHQRVAEHAERANVFVTAPLHGRQFSRSLFLLARQCAAIDLQDEYHRLLALAKHVARSSGGRTIDIDLYRALVQLGGARMARLMDSVQRRFRSA